jgi:hypothetical protein
LRKLYLLLPLLLFTACATHKEEFVLVNSVKSCEALSYKKEQLATIPVLESKDMNWQQIGHHSVVGVGALASFHPFLLGSGFIYLLPAITISYYNLFIETDEALKRSELAQIELKSVNEIMKSKGCKE